VTGWTVFGAALLLALVPAAARAQVVGPPAEVINQATRAAAITPADNTPLALGATRGIYIGAAAACAIAVILRDDTVAVTFAAVPSGNFMPIRAKVVMATNTTCTGIVGLW
jgi:hypothetical protein